MYGVDILHCRPPGKRLVPELARSLEWIQTTTSSSKIIYVCDEVYKEERLPPPETMDDFRVPVRVSYSNNLDVGGLFTHCSRTDA